MRQDFEGFRNPFFGVIENLVVELNEYWPWERGKDRYDPNILILLVHLLCNKSWCCLYLDVAPDNGIYEKKEVAYANRTHLKHA